MFQNMSLYVCKHTERPISYSSEITESLLQQITKENLPKQYGGDSVVPELATNTKNPKEKEAPVENDETVEADTLGVD
jgi:hypothetical protein